MLCCDRMSGSLLLVNSTAPAVSIHLPTLTCQRNLKFRVPPRLLSSGYDRITRVIRPSYSLPRSLCAALSSAPEGAVERVCRPDPAGSSGSPAISPAVSSLLELNPCTLIFTSTSLKGQLSFHDLPPAQGRRRNHLQSETYLQY